VCEAELHRPHSVEQVNVNAGSPEDSEGVLVQGSYGSERLSTALILTLFASLCVLVAAAVMLVAANRRVRHVESALLKAEDESLKRAGRIRALVKIASLDTNDEWLTTVLQIATAALRPGKPMFGVFTHLEGETIVTDGATFTSAAETRLRETHHPGAMFPYRRTIQSLLTGRTQAWNDLSFLRGNGMLAEELGVCSVIGTPLEIGRHTYFLMFASLEAMGTESFEEDDIAYVDAVAAQFANRFIQQQQFERIKFQIEHDALTGIENRVQFRKRLRDHVGERRPVAVAFIDLDSFREINDRVGHQIADEVLVEVAAGLAAICPEHSVARLSGDEFGVLLAGMEPLEGVAAALKPYAELFAKPFHTGDRTGTQMLSVRASIGVARFPADGGTAEDVMRRANVALGLAKARGGSTTLVFDASM
jgi:diguanylate cyclase (GGDEF)-like protein